jgi:circadian clock protein KaiC
MSRTTDSGRPDDLRRIPSGNAELDAVLGGGFPANGIHVILGEPGSGKTILVERLAFANAAVGDRPILFLTTLSEPLDKVVRYLQQFTFYDERLMGEAIVYDSLGEDLARDGVGVVGARLREAIATYRPKIVIVDSFKAVHDLATSVAEMRRALFDVAGLLTAYDTTTFLIGEYSGDDMRAYPEFAVADSLVQLARDKRGTRDERYLRVLKLRGSAYLEGLHAFRITPGGLAVFPRLVTPQVPPAYTILSERVETGIPGLDRILGGGLVRGRSAFVHGPTGSGKTTLALQFVLEGLRRGEPGLYVSFEENPSQLDAQVASLGADPADVRRRGLEFLYVSPVELQIDSIVDTIFEHVRTRSIRRLVVDAVGVLIAAASDLQRLHDYLYALTQHLAVLGVTSLMSVETLRDEVATRINVSSVSDHIIGLGIQLDGDRARRTLRIVKARGVAHDLDVHTMVITSDGLVVDA